MFYKIDSRRISLREYWWGTPNPLIILVAWLIKMLRIRLPGSADDPNVESLEPFRISPDRLPEEARERFHSVHEELQALGFHSPVCYWIHDVKQQTDIYQAVYLHNSGQAMARVHYRAWHLTKPAKEFFFSQLVTRFTDGTYLISTSGKRDLLGPAECRENRRVGATATVLWTMHQDALQEDLLLRTVRPIRDEYDLVEAVENHHALVRDFHVNRGVFVPLSEEEEQSVTLAAETAVEAVAEGEVPSQTSAILDEIEILQNKRSGWGAGVVLLLVSVGLFFALGAAIWPWGFVAMLLPILFFHELGHYGAMRLFRYSNVKMFFIPLLGAAVSGRHYNVPGWKKVVVSLAGPLPGIFLGAGLGGCAAYFRIDWLHQVAMLAIILNGFNLLPILPLDGGWVVHALLFSRHYILDAGFRLVAVAVLLAGSHFTGDRFLFFFGLFMAAGLPAAFRMAGVVSAIRKRGISTASPDNQTIPPEAAEAIADEIRDRFPQGLTNKHVAQFTLQAFEALNARPPGIIATILLGGVYMGSFLFALVALGLLALGLPMFMARNFTPSHPIEVTQVETAGQDRAGDVAEDEVTIVATFSDADEAVAQFAEFQKGLPADTTLLRFGQSLLVTVPPNGKVAPHEWQSRFALRTSKVLNPADSFAVGLSLAATAPSEEVAIEIERGLDNQFDSGMQDMLVPPWHPDQPPTLEQMEARGLYAQLLETAYVYEDPRYVKIDGQIEKAYEQEDLPRAAELKKDLKEVSSLIIEEQLQRMFDESDNPMERQLIELYRQKPIFEFEPDEPIDPDEPMPEEVQLARKKASEEFREEFNGWRSRVSELLGALPMGDGDVVPIARRYSLNGGMVDRTGAALEFTFYGLAFPVDGAPAIVRWLTDRGCTDMKYSFFGDD